jgi:hypothetical protein
MKKFFISAVLATAMIFGANAQQMWVGGSLGFTSERLNDADGDRIGSESVFSISPEFGFSLNNRWDVGLGFLFENDGFRIGDEDRESASTFGVAPFVQYTFLEFGRFQLLCRASAIFGMHNDDDFRTTVLGANITPYAHYVINDRFNLFTRLNFLSLDFVRASTSYDGTDLGSGSVFNFGADSNNLFNTGNFQVGFIFKF